MLKQDDNVMEQANLKIAARLINRVVGSRLDEIY